MLVRSDHSRARHRARTPAARKLLDLYNAKGVFNNREDDFESLVGGARGGGLARSRWNGKAASPYFALWCRPSVTVSLGVFDPSRLGMVINPPLTLPSFASVHR